MALVIPAKADYRRAGGQSFCANCAFYRGSKLIGWCRMYQTAVGGGMLCNKWAAK